MNNPIKYEASYKMNGQRIAIASPTLQRALKWAYEEARDNHRMVQVGLYLQNVKKADVWWYNGSIQNLRGKILVRFTNRKWQILRADGRISKRKVKL